MSFDDIRLPIEIEQGAAVSPEFLVTKVTLSNGYSRRNLRNSMPIRKWDISYGIQGLVGADATQGILAIYDFYSARGGTFGTFRMRDWLDYQLIDEVIATTDGSVSYQIIKTYTDFGSFVRTEDITKPSNHPDDPVFIVKFDGVPKVDGVDYDIDFNTGLLTNIAGSGVVLSVTGNFDRHVGFDDDVEFELGWAQVGRIKKIKVKEERG